MIISVVLANRISSSFNFFSRSVRTQIAPLLFALIGVIFASASARSEQIFLNYNQDGVAVMCASKVGNVDCTASVVGGQVTNAFTLTDPSRWVVDFNTTKRLSAKVISAKGSSLIKQARFGSGAGTLRVVFDLTELSNPTIGKGADNVTFSIATSIAPPIALETNSDLPVVTQALPTATAVAIATAIDVSPTVAGIVKSSPTATATKTAVPTKTPRPSPTPTFTPTVRPTKTPTSSPTPKASPTSKPTMTAVPTVAVETPAAATESSVRSEVENGKISKVIFERTDVGPAGTGSVVRVVLGGKAEARVTKLDERTFEVMVPSFQLAGRYLTLPYFPPEEFGGVTHVKLMQKGSDVQILIGVNRGVRIVPATKTGELILRVLE